MTIHKSESNHATNHNNRLRYQIIQAQEATATLPRDLQMLILQYYLDIITYPQLLTSAKQKLHLRPIKDFNQQFTCLFDIYKNGKRLFIYPQKFPNNKKIIHMAIYDEKHPQNLEETFHLADLSRINIYEIAYVDFNIKNNNLFVGIRVTNHLRNYGEHNIKILEDHFFIYNIPLGLNSTQSNSKIYNAQSSFSYRSILDTWLKNKSLVTFLCWSHDFLSMYWSSHFENKIYVHVLLISKHRPPVEKTVFELDSAPLQQIHLPELRACYFENEEAILLVVPLSRSLKSISFVNCKENDISNNRITPLFVMNISDTYSLFDKIWLENNNFAFTLLTFYNRDYRSRHYLFPCRSISIKEIEKVKNSEVNTQTKRSSRKRHRITS